MLFADSPCTITIYKLKNTNLNSEVQNRNNCALDETSMKLGIVVDHNPNVDNPMRTHLKTVPVPRSDDVIIGQDRKFFHKKI